MTAVANPIHPQHRPTWHTSDGARDGLTEEMSIMLGTGQRKTAQRTNSSSSINSSSSVTSNGTVTANATNADAFEGRKKPTRGLWPTGKSQPTSGLSVARSHFVPAVSTPGPTAATGLSALHGGVNMAAQQNANGKTQAINTARSPVDEPRTFLYLIPINGTFERKTINVPYFPEAIRIGRQTNGKTAPTQTNGFFDSKVLSRQHAEVYAERTGRVFIKDVKSSNGTFVNSKRLSPENKESEPHELRESDVLELGIDIVSEDQKTVVHHKVAARVEHAGIYPQPGDVPFPEQDGGGQYTANPQRQRVQGHGALPGLKTGGPPQGPPQMHRDAGIMQQQPWNRVWLQPVSTEHIVKRLNHELAMARQQAQDIDRTREHLGQLNTSSMITAHDSGKGSGKSSFLSTSGRPDTAPLAHPPAPPPSQPLPEEPEPQRRFNVHSNQPVLLRTETARPGLYEPSREDSSEALGTLYEEFQVAKMRIPKLQDHVRFLEQQLETERTARVLAEEKAYQLEHGPRKDSAEPSGPHIGKSSEFPPSPPSSEIDGEYHMSELQTRLDKLQANMSDMKIQMELYRRRAETAEGERDEARQSLAELIEEKRRCLDTHDEEAGAFGLKLARQRSKEMKRDAADDANGHTIRPTSSHRDVAVTSLLQQAGVEPGKHMTKQQAGELLQVLRRERLVDDGGPPWEGVSYNGLPAACALTTVMIGIVVMGWMNGWEKR